MKYIKDGLVLDQNRIMVNVKNGDKITTIINPSNEILESEGWAVYSEENYSVDKSKNIKINEVNDYDASSNVNVFSINGVSLWIDKSTRSGLMLRLNAESSMGLKYTTLWYNDIQFTLPVNKAIQMLYKVEIYASQCYDRTQYHIFQIKTLETLDEINAYDYTTGYPEKLNFNIE